MENLKNRNNVTKNSLLFKNSVFNLVGQGAPLLAAVFAIPILIHSLGAEKFGLLTLAWMSIGYLGFFDFGIGRATTKFVAEYIADGSDEYIPQLVSDSVKILIIIGIVAGIGTALIAPWLTASVLKVPLDLINEATTSFYIIAISLPLVLGATATRGYLEGCQNFFIVNAIRIPGGILLIAAPLFALPFTKNLIYLVAAIALSRAALFIAYAYYTHLGVKRIQVSPRQSAGGNFRKLFKFGGLVALTNVLGSLMSMAYIDRILIGHILGVGALTYYVTPFEMVTKILIIPSSLMAVLFPVFAMQKNDSKALGILYYRAIRYVFMITLPLVVFIIIYGYQGLSLWINVNFAEKSYLILELFAIGVLANSIAYIPFAMTQALGRPDVTAKRHLIELPFYVLLLYYFIEHFGLKGAAGVWVIWACVDMIFMFVLARKMNPIFFVYSEALKIFSMALAFIAAALLISSIANNSIYRMLGAALLLFVLGYFYWIYFLELNERTFIKKLSRQFFVKLLNILRILKNG